MDIRKSVFLHHVFRPVVAARVWDDGLPLHYLDTVRDVLASEIQRSMTSEDRRLFCAYRKELARKFLNSYFRRRDRHKIVAQRMVLKRALQYAVDVFLDHKFERLPQNWRPE